LHIDKSGGFPYPRAFGQTAAALIFWAWRPFLSIFMTDSMLRNER
jgi:hypothetical protein